MPARYSRKKYYSESYYHLYNRGSEKKPIFYDNQDYSVLLSYIKTYLEPKDDTFLTSVLLNPLSTYKEKDKAQKMLRMNNFYNKISLLCYCFMPNHYHILIYQKQANDMDMFMNSLWTRYTMYFNRKYKRVGHLFQNVYKGVLVTLDEQLLHLSRYIHLNPISKRRFRNPMSKNRFLLKYSFSSYQEYLGLRNTKWINTKIILNYFKEQQNISYRKFVEEYAFDEQMALTIKSVII